MIIIIIGTSKFEVLFVYTKSVWILFPKQSEREKNNARLMTSMVLELVIVVSQLRSTEFTGLRLRASTNINANGSYKRITYFIWHCSIVRRDPSQFKLALCIIPFFASTQNFPPLAVSISSIRPACLLHRKPTNFHSQIRKRFKTWIINVELF